MHYARLVKTTGVSYDQTARIYELGNPNHASGVKKVLTTSQVLINTTTSNMIYFDPNFLSFLREIYSCTIGTVIPTTGKYSNIPEEWWRVVIRSGLATRPGKGKSDNPYSIVRTSMM